MKSVLGEFALSLALCGCAVAPRAPSAPATATATPGTASVQRAAPPALNATAAALPSAERFFADERVSGAMALFDTKDGKLSCSDSAKCALGYVPASTFKIANTIIALETGLLSDAESPLPWDGKEYQNPDWNRDHTLRTAIQVSCLPCFQGIARKVGANQMQDWVKRLDYGNHDTSGAIDSFWLTGALRISPFEQLDFLRRLEGGELPIQEHTLDVVREVLTLDVGADYVLRGKTGLSGPPEQPQEVGWFVGFVELGERRVFFATVLDGHGVGVDLKPTRRRVTERVLRELGVLPS